MKHVLRVALLGLSIALFEGAAHPVAAEKYQDCITNCAIGYAACNHTHSEEYCNAFWAGCVFGCQYF